MTDKPFMPKATAVWLVDMPLGLPCGRSAAHSCALLLLLLAPLLLPRLGEAVPEAFYLFISSFDPFSRCQKQPI